MLYLAARKNAPPLECEIEYWEDFTSVQSQISWKPSGLPNYTGEWAIGETDYPQTFRGERALVLHTKNKRGAISSKLLNHVSNRNKTLIIQYEMRPQVAFTCSGAYLKLFSDPDFDTFQFSNETRYSIMFGPDRCMSDNHVHFIYNYKHPITKKYAEHKLIDAPKAPIDSGSHLYTLAIYTNNTYSIRIDNQLSKVGSLYFDFDPRILELREIPDPDDKEPSDWPSKTIFNGDHYVPNPNYKPYVPRKIRNPNYFVDLELYNFPPITALGFEIWVTNPRIAFTNILIAHSENAVIEWNKKDFIPRQMEQANPTQSIEDILRGSWWIFSSAFVKLMKQKEITTAIITITVFLIVIRNLRRKKGKSQ